MGIPLLEQLMMRLRKVPVRKIKRCMKLVDEAGLDVSCMDLQCQSLAGGDPEVAVEAMITLQQHGIDAQWMVISALQLTGRDLVESVDLCLEPHETSYDSSTDGNEPAHHANCEDGAAVRIRFSFHYTMHLHRIVGSSVDGLNRSMADGVRRVAGDCPNARALLERHDQLRGDMEAGLKSIYRTVEDLSLELTPC